MDMLKLFIQPPVGAGGDSSIVVLSCVPNDEPSMVSNPLGSVYPLLFTQCPQESLR